MINTKFNDIPSDDEPECSIKSNTEVPNLLTVEQFCNKHPAFKPGGLRHLIFHEEINGLKEAFLRVGRRRLINEKIFFKILIKQNNLG